MFIKELKNIGISWRIILIFCICTAFLMCTSCHKKIGVKPGGQLKKKESKCKCRLKGGIYSKTNQKDSAYYHLEYLLEMEKKG
jgi:hypothetical protein